MTYDELNKRRGDLATAIGECKDQMLGYLPKPLLLELRARRRALNIELRQCEAAMGACRPREPSYRRLHYLVTQVLEHQTDDQYDKHFDALEKFARENQP